MAHSLASTVRADVRRRGHRAVTRDRSSCGRSRPVTVLDPSACIGGAPASIHVLTARRYRTLVGRSSAMVHRAEVTFMSGGERCAAWLYQPDTPSRTSPCVVMAHGTTGTRDLGLTPYAERFAGAGCIVLVFDYRHFGASSGQPRQLVHIGHQLEDWREAVDFARRLPEVDPQRVALWGTSLSAGHVVAVAADDPRLAAVVAQLPWMGFTWRRGSGGASVEGDRSSAGRDRVGLPVRSGRPTAADDPDGRRARGRRGLHRR
ncbi:MAG: putative hydrolase [Actinomycetospora sp.]|nr:putative hydrolase [Actinomycetospora sp.]